LFFFELPGGDIMRRRPGGGIMKNSHGGGIKDGKSWRMNRRGIMEEESGRGHPGGGILDEES
jgi:hypothetical protein